MPFLESLSLSIPKIISAVWANGSRFLWSVAVAGAAAAALLWVGAHYSVPKAQAWWDDYGLMLMVGSAVVAVFAVFKMQAERPKPDLFLIADEGQSLWHHAKHKDGSMLTHFSLRFQATNRASIDLNLSKARILRPRIKRNQILPAHIATENPMNGTYSKDHVVPAKTRRDCIANLTVIGTVGGEGRRKPMQVKIAVQDNIGRWHKLVFVDLRDPQFPVVSFSPARMRSSS